MKRTGFWKAFSGKIKIAWKLDVDFKTCYISPVGKYEKFLGDILRGTSDANIPFIQMCHLLKRLGFE